MEPHHHVPVERKHATARAAWGASAAGAGQRGGRVLSLGGRRQACAAAVAAALPAISPLGGGGGGGWQVQPGPHWPRSRRAQHPRSSDPQRRPSAHPPADQAQSSVPPLFSPQVTPSHPHEALVSSGQLWRSLPTPLLRHQDKESQPSGGLKCTRRGGLQAASLALLTGGGHGREPGAEPLPSGAPPPSTLAADIPCNTWLCSRPEKLGSRPPSGGSAVRTLVRPAPRERETWAGGVQPQRVWRWKGW